MVLVTVFLSQYRRYPGQLLGLLSILACAGALWSGIQTLTGRAGAALEASNAALEPRFEVVRQDGTPLGVSDFARLRRAGLCVTPQLHLQLSDRLELLGIDPLTADCLRRSMRRSSIVTRLLETPERIPLWGTVESLALWRSLPRTAADAYPLESAEDLPQGLLLTDISEVARLAGKGEGRLALLLPAPVPEALPPGYELLVEDYGVNPGSLVDSFLFSLQALGWLALLVAALLLRSVYLLGLEQRRLSLRLLHRFGVERWRLRLGLLIEALLLALLGGTLGVWLGHALALGLAEGFGSTLAGLFSLDALGESLPVVRIWLQAALVLLLLVGWAGADLLRGDSDSDTDTEASVSQLGSARSGWCGVALLLIGAGGLSMVDQLHFIFLATGLCLLGAGLLVPAGLIWGLNRVQHRCTRPMPVWSCAELAALCRLLRLPLLALTLAIASAIGVQAMVGGFESTFTRWLEQRLQGDLYLDPGRAVATERLRTRLAQLPGVEEVLPMTRGQVLVEGRPSDLLALEPNSPLLSGWRFLQAEADPWNGLYGDGVLINEQLSRRQGVESGEWIDIQLGDKRVRRRVQAVYADYGRPAGEVVLPLDLLPDALPGRYTTFVLGLGDGHDALPEFPRLEIGRWQDRSTLLKRAQAVFERTFHLTRTLNLLTLLLAGTVLALMGLRLFRLRRPHYTLLHVAGIERRALRMRLVIHAVLLTLALGLLATPLGIWLSWVLVAKVNPAAFGWSLPLQLYPDYWLQVWLACGLIGALVGAAAGDPVRLETLKNE